ncbi:MAG TPA: hypothetical protein PLB70_09955 [Paludibacteraceae bacterium]|nr:hypothetical protein [Paludibacteraceae bacterium]
MLPLDSIPGDIIPGDSIIPNDSIPADSIPGDSIPGDSIPSGAIDLENVVFNVDGNNSIFANWEISEDGFLSSLTHSLSAKKTRMETMFLSSLQELFALNVEQTPCLNLYWIL